MKRRTKRLLWAGLGVLVLCGIFLALGDAELVQYEFRIDLNSGRCKRQWTSFGVTLKTVEVETAFSELARQLSLLDEAGEENWGLLWSLHYRMAGIGRGSGSSYGAYSACKQFAKVIHSYEESGYPLTEEQKREKVVAMLKWMREGDFKQMFDLVNQIFDELRALPLPSQGREKDGAAAVEIDARSRQGER
jgi:hypothetical protein